MIRMTSNNVMIKPDPDVTKLDSGIYIPEQAEEKPFTGTIIAVGPGKVLDNGTFIPINVNVGDKVLYQKYRGHDVKVKGVEYKTIKDEFILGVLEEV